MCKAASFIVTMNDILFSEKSDSHEEIIRENNLDDSDINFVRVEISPPNNDYQQPFDLWVFSTDQTNVPDWYNAENAERFCREKLPIWAKFHIFTCDSKHDGGNLSLIFLAGKHEIKGQTGGDVLALNTSTVRSSGQTGGYVLACDTSTVRSSGQTGGYVLAYDTSTVRPSGQTGGDVWAYGGSVVKK